MMFAIALFLVTTAPAAAPDQTADAKVVLELLDAIKSDDVARAKALVAPKAFIGNALQTQTSSFDDFANYARECKISNIMIIPTRSGQRLPISVDWTCLLPEPDRNASFWINDGQVTRISWGPRMTIKLQPKRSGS